MKIRILSANDYNSVVEIARKLGHRPEGGGWFSKEACELMIPFDIRVHRGYVAQEGDKVIGFVTYTSYDYAPFIGWIGVDPGSRRKGVGTSLIKAVEKELAKFGGKVLSVETPTKEEGLGGDYESTYNFYEKSGFELHRVKKMDDPENKCDCDIAVLRKVLE